MNLLSAFKVSHEVIKENKHKERNGNVDYINYASRPHICSPPFAPALQRNLQLSHGRPS